MILPYNVIQFVTLDLIYHIQSVLNYTERITEWSSDMVMNTLPHEYFCWKEILLSDMKTKSSSVAEHFNQSNLELSFSLTL